MRFLRKSLLLLLCAAFIVGCSANNPATSSNNAGNSNSSQSSSSANQQVELEWYFPIAVGGPLTAIIEKMADDFMAEHPDIKVKPIYTGSYDDTMTKVQTAVQGKNAPDLAVLQSTELYTLLDMNAILPLDDFIAGDGGDAYINDFFPAFLENSQTGGQTWSIPFQRSTIVLYYNKDLFKQAGLDPEKPPANWDELVEYAEKLTVRENGATKQWGLEIPTTGFAYWMFQSFALQNGKNLMSDDGKQVFIDTPENEEALQLWVDLAKDYQVMPEGVIDWATVPSDFIEGKAAMIYHTTGNLTNIKNNANFDFGVAFMPGKKQYGSPTGGGNFYIFKDIPEEKQKAAWTFVKWATEPERAAQWSIDTGYVGTRSSAYETDIMKEYITNFPQAAVARDQLEYASAELSTHNNGRIYKTVNDNLQAAVDGSLTPAEALQKAQQEAEQILAPFNK